MEAAWPRCLRVRYETIDNDNLIQMFPRCIWADSLHDKPLVGSPVIADLLERVRAIAALPSRVAERSPTRE